MTEAYIISLITIYAMKLNVDPNIAVAVAQVESRLDQSKVGKIGEIGIFQVRPEFSRFPKKDLKKIEVNIIEGISKLAQARDRCVHQKDLTWLTCYNAGMTGAKRIKVPKKFSYVVKVSKKIKENEYDRQIKMASAR